MLLSVTNPLLEMLQFKYLTIYDVTDVTGGMYLPHVGLKVEEL
jgi:hypothetical protein